MKPVKQSDLLDAIFSVLGAASTEAVAPQLKRRRPSTKGRSGSRVLLAEDNPVNQALAVAILEKQGHRVVVAHNGREALAALDRSPDDFDIVLMDVQMPELGGLEATALIREREIKTGRHIPIVAITAHALKGDRERCLEAGMDAYLAKPIQPQQLRKMIDDMVLTSAGPDQRGGESPRPMQVLDGRALLAQVDGDIRLLAKLTRLFLADSPSRLSSIRRAIAAQDARALQHAAHALKGSIANFAARGPFEAAVALEAMGKRNDLTGAEGAYLTLKKEVARLERALVAVGTQKRRRNPGKKRERIAVKNRTKQPTRRSGKSTAGRRA
jgi:CheY-like chemotaxis protein